MIPFLLAALGGYLIGDSMKDSQTFADGGETSFGDEFYIIIKTPKGLVTKKDFYGMGYNKKELIELFEGKGLKYNQKGEKFGGQALEEYEFFLKKPTKYDIQLPKSKMARGGKVKKGDIGKSGKQYTYTLQEWEDMAKKRGLLVSPSQWWKSQEGQKYKDSFGRTKTWGQYPSDKENEMNMYGYRIASGMDLGSKIIPESAIRYVKENNFTSFAKGGSIGVDKASNGFKKKFVWIKEQNGVATELLQQKSFEEDFKELSNSSRFKLIRDDKGMKVFDDDVSWRITYRLKPIFAYGGQLELDFEPEEQIDESTLKARRYVELQNLANEEIELFGEIEDDTMKEIEELGESLNSHEVELVMEMYNKKKFAEGGVLDKKMYVVEIYSIESDDEGDDDTDLQKYTLRVSATDEGDAIDSAESLFVEEYGAMPIFSAKVVNSFDDGGNVGGVKLSDYNPRIHDEEITISNLGYDYAIVRFELMYADNAMVSYLLVYDVDRRDYDWQLEKVYRIEVGKMTEEYLYGSPEYKAIQSNKFVIEAVDDKIGEALNN